MAVEPKQRKTVGVEDFIKRLELGLVPDEEIRRLLRIECARRLQWGYKPTHEQQLAEVVKLAHSLRQMPIAVNSDRLDLYLEVPVSFLQHMFGSKLKESCCYFKDDSVTLDEAEIEMLELYCERAQIKDGQSILEPGCGQGTLLLYLAQKYKNCRLTGLTNSVLHKEFVEERCKKLNLSNVEIILADISTHEMDGTFDRVLVIEMFEHMKNHALLLKKLSKWMTPDGLLFVEYLCHKTLAYHHEPIDEDDWSTGYMFPPGNVIWLSSSFLLYFQDDVSVVNQWTLSGKQFSRTNEEWLKKLDANMDAAKETLKSLSDKKETIEKWINYWRFFCMYGAEVFGYSNGEEWMLTHILFKKK